MSQVRRQSAVLPRPNWGWQDAAACKGEDLLLFFGPDGERQPEREIRERKAKGVCAACPVRLECLNYAVSRPEKYGTWGGLNEDERSVYYKLSIGQLPGGKEGVQWIASATCPANRAMSAEPAGPGGLSVRCIA